MTFSFLREALVASVLLSCAVYVCADGSTFHQEASGSGGVLEASLVPGSTQMQKRLTLKPCGILAWHIHPKADKLMYMVKGQILVGVSTAWNSVPTTLVKAGQNFRIPQGALHYMINNECTDAQTVYTYTAPDPGQQYVFEEATKLSTDILMAEMKIEAMPTWQGPLGVDPKCMAKCKATESAGRRL